MLKHTLRQWLAISCLAILTTACGGGGGSGGSNSGSSSGTSSSTSSAPSTAPSSSPSTSPSAPTGVSHTVRISWEIPSTRADGTSLAASAISAYRLFYTREDSASSEDAIVVISNGSTTNTNITLAAAGTYTFAITAIDLNGTESALSTPASITIN